MKKLMIVLCSLLLLIGSGVSYAKNIELEQPIFVYGAGLNEEEIESTKGLLGFEKGEMMSATGEDYEKYLGEKEDDRNMISSIVVSSNQEDKILVTIKTPKNITAVTDQQYRSAVVTSGVTGVDLTIGSLYQVTGTSALTGLFKALEAKGVALDQDRVKVANEEVEVVSKIAQENNGQGNFTNIVFDDIIINIKTVLNNLPEDQKNNLTTEDIENIVKEAIEKYDLSDVFTQEQINQLTALFEKYAGTDAINSDEVINQLKQISSTAVEKAKELYGIADETGLLDSIGKFFSEIFSKIGEAFLNLFN